MLRKALTRPGAVPFFLILQFLPLLLLPTASYSPKSQEWWLPALLAALVLAAVLQLLFRHSIASWPWTLIAFSHGFNIISRLMLLMPHATMIVEGKLRLNTTYVFLTVIAMLLSVFVIWYFELPEVRNTLLLRGRKAQAA